MTVVLFQNQESESTNDTVNWAEKVSISGDISAGDYIIWVSAEFTGIQTTRGVEIHALIDGVERAYGSHIPQIASSYHGFSSMGLLNIPTDGIHSVSIEFRAITTPQTAKCRRARILVMKH